MSILIVLIALLAGAPSAVAGTRALPAPADSVASPTAASADTLPLRLTRAATVVSDGGDAQRLVEPAGVAVDAFGRLYVSDAGLNRVQRYEANGTWIGSAGTLGSDAGQLRRPGAVATLGNLGVAVLDCENRRVVSYDLHGRLVGTLIDLDAAPLKDQLGYVDPVALAADRGGAVVIADGDRDRLLAFDFAGRYLHAIGGFGGRGGSFRSVSGVASAPRGELVTSDRAHRRIQRLDAGGRVLAVWPLPGGPGRGALAVAVDDSSRVAVADELSGRLWIFDASGRLLALADGAAGPRGLAFAPDGTLLVAEARAARVTRWSLAPAGAAPGE